MYTAREIIIGRFRVREVYLKGRFEIEDYKKSRFKVYVMYDDTHKQFYKRYNQNS